MTEGQVFFLDKANPGEFSSAFSSGISHSRAFLSFGKVISKFMFSESKVFFQSKGVGNLMFFDKS